MPPMDPRTRFYYQGRGPQYWELYMVLNNRKTWYEARKHCQHNELDLVFMNTIGMAGILTVFRTLTKKQDLPQNEVLWHGLPQGWNSPKGARCPVMAMRYDLNLFFDRKCNQTTGKDEYGNILVGYFCGREISEGEYFYGLRHDRDWDY
ncbi:unnamed protein product [Nippostrongylus brasiliensis]|uniref:C-type lectin domain-containing protein n=1 Tax=Nippostrongylus brasiliensis TaxID=27835 RepID=A0A0N4YUF7_NIPBR|nr:unnamed protein product [Nippostrongylus brasiliensis]